jgi:hypothetical protein
MSRYYTGPVSDHFDGVRFFDLHGAPPKSRRNLSRWVIGRRWRAARSAWPAWAPSPYADRPPARVQGAAWRIAYIGHASLLIQTAGLNLAEALQAAEIPPERFRALRPGQVWEL